jgi:hypothetical protein
MISSGQQPFSYYVDGRNQMPLGLSRAGAETSVNAAWNTWNLVTCSGVKVRSSGFTSNVSPFDVFSTTPVFVLSQSDPDFDNTISRFVGAVTIPKAYAGVLENCDIFVNGATQTWSNNPVTPIDRLDLETVMLHEAGHCLGLGHFGSSINVMRGDISPGEQKRAFGENETDALCQQYPVSGVAGSPCLADGGCGASPMLRCLPQPMTNGLIVNRCSQGCTPSTGGGCDAPTACQTYPFGQGYAGACLLPGTSVTKVGKVCSDKVDCGASLAECQLPIRSPSAKQFWADGYCFQRCGTGIEPCPQGSLCYDLGTEKRCLQTCRVGLADCRPEYACVETTASNGTGVCQPRCYADNDCDDPGDTCRTCDGLCVPRQNLNGKIGDACSADNTCGAGQVCKALTPAASSQKQCTVACGRGCGVCPIGSSCTPLANSELNCLLNCSGPGTCPSGLRCGDTSVGKGCLPPCTTNSNCPVGQACAQGECVAPPSEDASCGVLCNGVDAGKPIVPIVKDGGGTGGGGSVGCGCQGVDTSGLIAVFILIFLVTRKRR